MPLGLHRFLNQILFISPLFWFMELLQNKVYLLTIDRYGWGYEPDPHGKLTAWYSFRSLLPWATRWRSFRCSIRSGSSAGACRCCFAW